MYKTLIVLTLVSQLFSLDYVVCESSEAFVKTVKLYRHKIGDKPDNQIWFRAAVNEDDLGRYQSHGWFETICADSQDGTGSISSLSGSYGNNTITIKDHLGSIGLISLESKSGEIVLRSGYKMLFIIEDKKSPN